MGNNDADWYDRLFWRPEQLPQAIGDLAHQAGMSGATDKPHGRVTGDEQRLEGELAAIAGSLNCDLASVSVRYGELADFLQQAAPLIIKLSGQRFVLVIRAVVGRVQIWTPGGRRWLSCDRLVRGLRFPLEKDQRPRLNKLVNDLGLPCGQRESMVRTLLLDQLSERHLTGFWLLRSAPGSSLVRQLRQNGFFSHLAGFAGIFFLAQGVFVGSWLVIGQMAMNGYVNDGWLTCWSLLLLTWVVLQCFGVWIQNILAIKLGCLLKRRLLYGILQLQPEQIHHKGAGRFMGVAMEAADSLEGFAAGGGFNAVVALFQCLTAGLLLLLGRVWLLLLLLGLWLLVVLWLLRRYISNTRQWLAIYQRMSTDLVERMVGHRTRLAQEDPAHWHDEEDRQLARYGVCSGNLDRIAVNMKMLSRGWMSTAGGGLLIGVAMGEISPTVLGIGLVGLILVLQGLTALSNALVYLRDALMGWWEIKPLFKAAAENPAPTSTLAPESAGAQSTLLTVDHLTFRHSPGLPVILDNIDLNLTPGQRMLLEGPSGGGKSTLAGVLSGLLPATSGRLVLKGVAQNQWSPAAWRKAVISVPQFHENHVFGETFLFNLLMGGQWPPDKAQVKKATALCRELGLGPLLERMPAGLQQMVGECGWVLSHGERSRLFMARALLQPADIIILDESFAALDPETLIRVMECVLRRSPTLLVIAHP